MFLFLLTSSFAPAQDNSALQQILERLDRVEKENHALAEEIRSLRRELAIARPQPPADAPPVEDRVGILEARVEEQSQSKVETSQKLPLRVTGMVLFNSFLNSKFSGASENPTVAALNPGQATGGATLRQSVIGLRYDGGQTVFGAKVTGSLYMDFFGGTTASLNHLLRLRLAAIDLDWKNTTLSVGQDKPLIAPREPNSLAQVGVSPLTGAGNLWLWQPQVHVEQRFQLGRESGLRAQAGVFQTSETSIAVPAEYTSTLERARPGYEGRFELWHRFNERKRFEIAPGFHISDTHVAGTSVPSRIFSLDWFVNPFEKLQITGAYFKGENVASLGAIRQGVTTRGIGDAIPIHSIGGWAQFRILATERLSFNLYGGQEDDRNRDLAPGSIGKNQNYAANVMYRIAPNVIISFEGSQIRTTYLRTGTRRNNHYDLALAYQF